MINGHGNIQIKGYFAVSQSQESDYKMLLKLFRSQTYNLEARVPSFVIFSINPSLVQIIFHLIKNISSACPRKYFRIFLPQFESFFVLVGIQAVNSWKEYFILGDN